MATRLKSFEAKHARDHLKVQEAVTGVLGEAVRSADCRRAILTILSDPEHRHFVAMYNIAINRILGMPRQSVEVSGPQGAAIKFEPLEIILPQLDQKIAEATAMPVVQAAIAGPAEPDLSWAPEISIDEEDAA